MTPQFSNRHRFADWPNPEVPEFCAGVYAVWDGARLMYCGMSGRDISNAKEGRKHGLINRLANHASGRLSGDQFCVYVANRLVIPSLKAEQLAMFSTGDLTLDKLTKQYIAERFEYTFAQTEGSKTAFDLERRCRSGEVFGVKPYLNPL
jgi:hypothetical protein